jgi:hypothetical protein
MDISIYDAQIAQAKSEANDTKAQLQSCRDSILTTTKAFLARYYQETVERAVKSKHETTKILAAEKLKQLKSDLNQLVARTPSIVDEAFADPKLWPLLSEWPAQAKTDSATFFDLRRKEAEELQRVQRSLLGHVATLLVDAGYLTEKDTEWENLRSKLPTYKYGVGWSNEMSAASKQYEEASSRLRNAYEKLHRAEQAKAEAEAKNIWDQT